jgi:hypothetical protein
MKNMKKRGLHELNSQDISETVVAYFKRLLRVNHSLKKKICVILGNEQTECKECVSQRNHENWKKRRELNDACILKIMLHHDQKVSFQKEKTTLLQFRHTNLFLNCHDWNEIRLIVRRTVFNCFKFLVKKVFHQNLNMFKQQLEIFRSVMIFLSVTSHDVNSLCLDWIGPRIPFLATVIEPVLSLDVVGATVCYIRKLIKMDTSQGLSLANNFLSKSHKFATLSLFILTTGVLHLPKSSLMEVIHSEKVGFMVGKCIDCLTSTNASLSAEYVDILLKFVLIVEENKTIQPIYWKFLRSSQDWCTMSYMERMFRISQNSSKTVLVRFLGFIGLMVRNNVVREIHYLDIAHFLIGMMSMIRSDIAITDVVARMIDLSSSNIKKAILNDVLCNIYMCAHEDILHTSNPKVHLLVSSSRRFQMVKKKMKTVCQKKVKVSMHKLDVLLACIQLQEKFNNEEKM